MRTRRSLRHRILAWLAGYAALLLVAMFTHSLLVNEEAEQLVWESLLDSELAHFLERKAKDPDYLWTDTDNLKLYVEGSERLEPEALAALPAGVSDDVALNGREHVVLVKSIDGKRHVLTLDITRLEHEEEAIAAIMLVSGLLVVLVAGLVIAWGLGRITRPLSRLAADISQLQPDRNDQHLAIDDSATSELVIIADALNDYLRRNQRFVERERVFINSASHELRTPIAVIAGATELALAQDALPAAARTQMNRVRNTAREVEQLISLLLVLAKDPARLGATSDRIALHQLLPELVDDHRHLTRGKDLVLLLETMPACDIVAPVAIVQVAIGNLLRNAIENSDRGEIHVGLQADATVVIEDPGHGMSPEEISALYAQVARDGREGGGIGLDLISRLCEHLGWRLEFSSVSGRGTRATLHLRQD